MNKIEKARIIEDVGDIIYSILLQANEAIESNIDDELLKDMINYLHIVDVIMSRNYIKK